jgi:hypothetical protein
MNQLDRIMELTGRPSAEDLDSIQSPFAATMMESCSTMQAKRIQDLFPHASRDACDLLVRLLQFNPKKRIRCGGAAPARRTRASRRCSAAPAAAPAAGAPAASEPAAAPPPPPPRSAEEALRHPYVNQFHNPDDEPSCSRVITIPINDNHKYTIAEYRDRLYQEIVKKKKELRRKLKEKEERRVGLRGCLAAGQRPAATPCCSARSLAGRCLPCAWRGRRRAGRSLRCQPGSRWGRELTRGCAHPPPPAGGAERRHQQQHARGAVIFARELSRAAGGGPGAVARCACAGAGAGSGAGFQVQGVAVGALRRRLLRRPALVGWCWPRTGGAVVQQASRVKRAANCRDDSLLWLVRACVGRLAEVAHVWPFVAAVFVPVRRCPLARCPAMGWLAASAWAVPCMMCMSTV